MAPSENEYEIRIKELENSISDLQGNIESKNKELEKYQNLHTKYRRLKKKANSYRRERIILLVFSLVLIGVLCYQGYKINNSKVEQEKLQQLYKKKNEEGPNQDIYLDPTP
jgi:TolA-binding protein